MSLERSLSISIVAVVLSAACNEATPPATGASVTLTAQQAATIQTRVTQLAPLHPELAWLSDSISLVIRSGAEVDSVDVATNLGVGPFYAVAIQRGFTPASPVAFGSATFDVIL